MLWGLLHIYNDSLCHEVNIKYKIWVSKKLTQFMTLCYLTNVTWCRETKPSIMLSCKGLPKLTIWYLDLLANKLNTLRSWMKKNRKKAQFIIKLLIDMSFLENIISYSIEHLVFCQLPVMISIFRNIFYDWYDCMTIIYCIANQVSPENVTAYCVALLSHVIKEFVF